MDNYSYTRVNQKKKLMLQYNLLLHYFNKGAFLRLSELDPDKATWCTGFHHQLSQHYTYQNLIYYSSSEADWKLGVL